MRQTQQIAVIHQQIRQQIQALIVQAHQTKQTVQIQEVTQQVAHQHNQVMPH